MRQGGISLTKALADAKLQDIKGPRSLELQASSFQIGIFIYLHIELCGTAAYVVVHALAEGSKGARDAQRLHSLPEKRVLD